MVHEVSCTSCEFMIRSEDEAELIDLVRQHAKKVHGMSMSRSDVRKMAKAA